MSGKTLNRVAISDALFRKIGLSRNESAKLVDAVLDNVSEALVRGEKVKISTFGTFSMRQKAARVGRNPQTGQEVPIPARKVLSFRASDQMKKRVMDGNRR